MLWVHHCIIAAGIYTDIYCRRLCGVDRGGGDVSGPEGDDEGWVD